MPVLPLSLQNFRASVSGDVERDHPEQTLWKNTPGYQAEFTVGEFDELVAVGTHSDRGYLVIDRFGHYKDGDECEMEPFDFGDPVADPAVFLWDPDGGAMERLWPTLTACIQQFVLDGEVRDPTGQHRSMFLDLRTWQPISEVTADITPTPELTELRERTPSERKVLEFIRLAKARVPPPPLFDAETAEAWLAGLGAPVDGSFRKRQGPLFVALTNRDSDLNVLMEHLPELLWFASQGQHLDVWLSAELERGPRQLATEFARVLDESKECLVKRISAFGVSSEGTAPH